MPPGGDRFQTPVSQFLFLWGQLHPWKNQPTVNSCSSIAGGFTGPVDNIHRSKTALFPCVTTLVNYPQESHSSGTDSGGQPDP